MAEDRVEHCHCGARCESGKSQCIFCMNGGNEEEDDVYAQRGCGKGAGSGMGAGRGVMIPDAPRTIFGAPTDIAKTSPLGPPNKRGTSRAASHRLRSGSLEAEVPANVQAFERQLERRLLEKINAHFNTVERRLTTHLEKKMLEMVNRDDDHEDEFLDAEIIPLEVHDQGPGSPFNTLAINTVMEPVADICKKPFGQDEEDQGAAKASRGLLFIGQFHFQESVVDAALLIFIHRGDAGKKFLMMIGHIMSLIVQFLLTAAVGEYVYRRQIKTLNDDDRGSMLEWRTEQLPLEYGARIISETCNNNRWTYQNDQMTALYFFLHSTISGRVVSTVCVFVWVMTCLVDIRRLVELCLGLYQLPHLTTGPYLKTDQSKRIGIVGISHINRWGALLFVCIPRIALSLTLLWLGSMYLVHTTEMSEVLNNAVALVFIMTVDEIFAKVMFTRNVATVLKRMKPLPCGYSYHFLGLSYFDWFRWLLASAALIVVFCFFVVPMWERILAAEAIVCDNIPTATAVVSPVGSTTTAPTKLPVLPVTDVITTPPPTDVNASDNSSIFSYAPTRANTR